MSKINSRDRTEDPSQLGVPLKQEVMRAGSDTEREPPDASTSQRTVSASPKPFVCPDCGKTFSLPWNFKAHQRVHTGEKPYSCRLCGRRFSQLSNQRSHERTHRDPGLGRAVALLRIVPGPPASFPCQRCGQIFVGFGGVPGHRCAGGEESSPCDSNPAQTPCS
ncbi:UNVERIFIED_CONTAM: hypothetical protein FKN15_020807 [Acipenser sinensis]